MIITDSTGEGGVRKSSSLLAIVFPGAHGAGFRHLRLGRREKGLTVKERPTREPLARNRCELTAMITHR